ncbi:hypothetical protein ACFV6Y_39295 [Streptomyces massasporeus]|uniref:hypothetical protein n=1 Tax=Streptomyces massasporeus TaxID=67324 RepID=UPI00364D8872
MIDTPVIDDEDVTARQQYIDVVKLTTHGRLRLRWKLKVNTTTAVAKIEVWYPAGLDWHEVWTLTDVPVASTYTLDPLVKLDSYAGVFNELASYAEIVLDGKR